MLFCKLFCLFPASTYMRAPVLVLNPCLVLPHICVCGLISARKKGSNRYKCSSVDKKKKKIAHVAYLFAYNLVTTNTVCVEINPRAWEIVWRSYVSTGLFALQWFCCAFDKSSKKSTLDNFIFHPYFSPTVFMAAFYCKIKIG